MPRAKERCEQIRYRKDWTRPLTPEGLSSLHPLPRWGEGNPPTVPPCTRGDQRGVVNSFAPNGGEGARSDGGRGGWVRGWFGIFSRLQELKEIPSVFHNWN